MKRRSLILLILALFSSYIFAQSPVQNDRCKNALLLEFGQPIMGQDNRFAQTTPKETPEAIPLSCIKTFENDLWYYFVSQEGFQSYEIIISPTLCNTPAGLQALIIRGDSCDTSQYEYVDCSNPNREEALRLYADNPEAGKLYWVYVDGFDGTECVFDIVLIPHQETANSIERFQRQGLDYQKEREIVAFSNFHISIQNNEVEITWQGDPQSDIAFYQIQRVLKYSGQVIGRVKPINSVGEGEVHYRYVYKGSIENGEEYCYRVAGINQKGEKFYSEDQCIRAQLIENFFVTKVFESREKGIYLFQLHNHQKQTLTFQLLNLEDEVLKSMVLKKEAKGTREIRLDMKAYAPGPYRLRAEAGGNTYVHEFSKK